MTVLGSRMRWRRPGGGICCSIPPCVAISLQRSRYTYNNLIGRGEFTISIPSTGYVKEADYFGIASGRHIDKFEETGLTPERAGLVDAPYVSEFPVVLECRVLHRHELGTHVQFVGEIMDVRVDGEVFGKGGRPDIELIRPFIYDSATQEYRGIGPVVGHAFSAGKELVR